MEQIYYTQCPVGYGLGASNGFQIKRMTPGYPISGDFRHLGLRAFPGGGRVLAPPALRFRRDGDVAEVAWLTPRAHEYETERGLWGRPGGLFAHGVRLASEDLGAIKEWPAGLWESAAWTRSDPEPSRGRPPGSVDLTAGAMAIEPEFAVVAQLAGEDDPEQLARLLAGVAIAVREGRTLFVIDEPTRLGPRMALLTFAFPEAMRGALTFSTFHDRPEELPGFRIQGTSPFARPNKTALAALGIVADLVAGTFEPSVEPPLWARTLAGWFTRGEPVDEADWAATDARAKKGIDGPWSDDGLDHLVGFPEAYRAREAPESAEGWARLGSFATWSGRAGVGDEWLRPRGAAWWAEEVESGRPEARAAFLAHLAIRDAWRDVAAAKGWGEAFALWFAGVAKEERDDAVAATLRAMPRGARPAFARALFEGLAPVEAAEVLRRLKGDPSCDRGMLIPLEAGVAAAAIRDGGDPAALRALVEPARGMTGALAAVLDAAAAVAADRPEVVPHLAKALAAAFDPDAPDQGQTGLTWALRRERDAAAWLGPALRPVLADPGRVVDWRALRDRASEDDRPALARAWLDLASDPKLPDDAYRWGVEDLLLAMSPRPADPRWADLYLQRVPSGLVLAVRLTSAEFRKKGLRAWVDAAKSRGEVSPEQAERINVALAFYEALRSNKAESLLDIRLPGVPPEERGALLKIMRERFPDATGAGLMLILDAARDAWPGGFDAGAAGLEGVGKVLARPLLDTPDRWLARLAAILDRLRPDGRDASWAWEPDGLAAEVAAASARLDRGDPWPLRQTMLDDDRAWRALTLDAARDLRKVGADGAVAVVADWDQILEKPKPERFFAVIVNACDGPSLARVASARANDLKTLPPLPWWGHAGHPDGRDDIRDRFARIVPMAPLPEEQLMAVRGWIGGNPAGLSAFGMGRWRCLDALSGFARESYDAATRGPIVRGWNDDRGLTEALAALADLDRHRFLARLILGLDDVEPPPVEPLAKWLQRAGVRDVERLGRWAEELDGLAEVSDQDRIGRMRLVSELKKELATLLREARESPKPRAKPAGGS